MASKCAFWLLVLSIGFAAGVSSGQEAAPNAAQVKPPAEDWKPLFDGKTLGGWKETPFIGRGKVTIQDGAVTLGTGVMTGITWTKDFPKINYEVRLEAARLQGGDFFSSITFPVHDSYCTLVVGGWGGMLVGLSSLDTYDASENETTVMYPFKRGQWYALRLRVIDGEIDAWINDELVVAANIVGREVSLRPGDIEQSIPFGFASFNTTGAVRKMEYRLLPTVAEAEPAKPQ